MVSGIFLQVIVVVEKKGREGNFVYVKQKKAGSGRGFKQEQENYKRQDLRVKKKLKLDEKDNYFN